MAELVVRKGEERDLDQMAEIEKLCFTDPWSREILSEDMLGNMLSTYVVAELLPDRAEAAANSAEAAHDSDKPAAANSAPEIVGYVGFWLVMDECQINNVAVRPDKQRQHIGRILMTTVMDAAGRAGAKTFTLEVRAGNAAAIALYEGMGFKRDAVRYGYYSDGEDAVLMSCEVYR